MSEPTWTSPTNRCVPDTSIVNSTPISAFGGFTLSRISTAFGMYPTLCRWYQKAARATWYERASPSFSGVATASATTYATPAATQTAATATARSASATRIADTAVVTGGIGRPAAAQHAADAARTPISHTHVAVRVTACNGE